MKKQLFCTIFFVLLISVCFGQKPYKVVFYNLENFFDTINDPEVKDDEFTPKDPKNGIQPSIIKSLAISNEYCSVWQLSTKSIQSLSGYRK